MRRAFVISLLNPKAILFVISFFVQFLDPTYAYPALSVLLLASVLQVCSVLYLSALILGGTYLAAQFRRRARPGQRSDRGGRRGVHRVWHPAGDRLGGMMVGMADVTVARNEGQYRYEALIDGAVAGIAQFRSSPGRAVFWHTEVDPAYAGKGVGSTLVREALDDVRARGEKVVAQCTFVAAYVKRYPEYADLVVED